MNKEFKKEWIIKRINEFEDDKYLDFIFGFTVGYINNQRFQKEKESKNER